MLLGIISDTHGHIRNTIEGVRLLEARNVEQILHCGDIGSVAIPGLFSTPTHFVFGNVDEDAEELRASVERAGHSCHGRFGSLNIAGLQFALLHGDDPRRWHSTISDPAWDIVCFGHTHRRETRHQGKTLLLNPGAVYRATPHSVALLELPSRQVEFLDF